MTDTGNFNTPKSAGETPGTPNPAGSQTTPAYRDPSTVPGAAPYPALDDWNARASRPRDFDFDFDDFDDEDDGDEDDSWLTPVADAVRSNPVGTALMVAGIALMFAPKLDRGAGRKRYRALRAESASQWSHYRSNAMDYTKSLRDRITDGTHDMTEDARSRVIAARQKALDAASETGDYLRHGQERAQSAIEHNPLLAGSLALAAGAAIGASLPHTRMEDRRFGALSDRLMEEAHSIYETEREKLYAAAHAAVDEMRDIATETVRDVKDALPDGQDASETVKKTARDGADRVAKAARNAADEKKG